MRNVIVKDTFREIKKSFGRFLSILAIVTLGVAFFAGINVAAPDMKKTADTYYDEQNFMDFKLVSTVGFDEDDIDAIKSSKNVDGVYATNSLDVLTNINDNELVLKIHGIPNEENRTNLNNYINIPKLIEGRLPVKSGECVIEEGNIGALDVEIGTKLIVTSGNEESINNTLKTNEYTVVGTVNSPSYLSFEKGNSSIGSGKVSSYIMILDEDIKSKDYYEVYVTVNNSKELNSFTEKYEEFIQPTKDDLEDIGKNRVEKRYNNIIFKSNIKLDEAKKEYVDKKLKFDEELKKSEDNLNILESNKLLSDEEIMLSREKLRNENEKAEQLLVEAKKEIDNAQFKIDNMQTPEWYILGRDSNYSFVDYGGSADRVSAIAKVFPIFFFLVAALVCLTTMTRMVDEQRINIGTLKALGYSKIAIASKYVLYAAIASSGGSILGIAIGFTLFPTVIFNAYSIMYTLPPVILEFNVFFATLATLSAVIITTMAAFLACNKELIEMPSLLMRPKAPKEGKRILLERIPLIWNKLNFSKKVTARNIFRYKKRFFMTVIGISGCTALLLAGFGIKDSIKTIVSKQFGDVYKYNMTIVFNGKTSLEEQISLINDSSINGEIESYTSIKSKNIDITSNSHNETITVIVPKEKQEINKFITLRDRKSKSDIYIEEDGIVLTEKVAKQLNVNVSDTIFITKNDIEKIPVKVTGITEQYVMNYMYMSENLYNKVFNEEIDFTEIIAKISDEFVSTEDIISKDMLQNENVTSINFNSKLKDSFKDTITSLNYVVLLMIVSAGALAFVVLYNLTNVNISERIREIATIKVLGFYDKEVSAYVYRENFILTFIGTIVGLLIGVLLHKFIMTTAEPANIMFGRNIEVISFIYASILTLLFASIVNFVMYFKLKKTPMVESLKSVD